MFNFQYILKHKGLFPHVIGISYYQFEKILHKFSPALRRAEHKKAHEKERLRAPGGGRKSKLETDRQKLFFILFYYKVYPTFRFAQVLFEISIGNLFYWKEFLEPVLSEALGYQIELPSVRIRHFNHWIEVCPALKEFIVDSTERPVQRPKKPKVQEKYYSGKKKKHAVKNHILVNPKTKKILSVSKTVEGKLHDKKLLEKDPIILKVPPGSTGMGDSAYEGMNKVHPWIKFVTPKKKPRGRKLTESEKETNTAISSIRTKVEHPFAYMKHFAILANKFRNSIERAHQPFVNIACLYNFARTHRY